MANLKILGLPDVTTAGVMSVGGGAGASASLALSNILTEEPSEFWRSQGYEPANAYFFAASKASIPYLSSGVAIAGANLWPSTGQVRTVLANAQLTFSALWEDLVPTAIEASSNMAAGVVGSVDEGFTPDGVTLGPSTTASDWSVRLSFGTPAVQPRNDGSTNVEEFRIFAMPNTAPDGPYNAPTVAVSLLEGGVLKRLLGRKALTNTAGQWLYFTWDVSELSTQTGADVEILLQFAAAGPNYGKLDSVVWRSEPDLAFVNLTVESDSGWVPVDAPAAHPGITGVTSTFFSPIPQPNTAVLNDHSAIGDADSTRYVYVFLREDHSPDLMVYNRTTLRTVAPGFIEVGKLISGPIFSPEVNFDPGDFLGFEDLSSQQVTAGGQEFGSRRNIRRTGNVPLSWLTSAEIAFLIDRLILGRGVLSPVLLSMLPGDDDLGAVSTFYATLRNPETLIGYRNTDTYKNSAILKFEEKL